jgi:hypothetical protein
LQTQAQAEKADNDILQALRNNTNLKVVFRLKDAKEAEDLAHMVVPLDLEQPVGASTRPTAVGVELVNLASKSTSVQESTSHTRSKTRGTSVTETESHVESYAETWAESDSVSESSMLSSSSTASQLNLAGAGHGSTSSETSSGINGNIVLSEGSSVAAHAARAISSSSSEGRAAGVTRGATSMHGTTVGQAHGYAVSRGNSSSTETGIGQTRGTSETEGKQEAFKPIYQNLATSYHSKDHALYFAAQTLRGLTAGHAFINFVDADGMHAALIKVAPVQSCAPSHEEFEPLRERILNASPSASPISEAIEHIESRQRELLAAAERTRAPAEPDTLAGFRIKKKRLSKKHS